MAKTPAKQMPPTVLAPEPEAPVVELAKSSILTSSAPKRNATPQEAADLLQQKLNNSIVHLNKENDQRGHMITELQRQIEQQQSIVSQNADMIARHQARIDEAKAKVTATTAASAPAPVVEAAPIAAPAEAATNNAV